MLNDRKDVLFLYVTETGGHLDTIRDDGAITEALLRQLWAEWDHIKNGPHKEEAKCWDLLWVSPKAGKRESRRFLGDVILTQTDLEEGKRFPDDIAWGGHDLDDHQPLGEGADIFAHSVPPLYGIPLRACYSRNVPNLLLAGRLISATHLAHSSTRVMRTGGAIGQGVGLAAALCRRRGCTPREVYERYLDELVHGLLEADGAVLLRPLRRDGDAAREAAVTAGSEMRFNDQEPAQFVPLIAPAGIVLWDWQPKVEAVEVCLRNRSAAPQPLTLKVHRARRERKWKSHDEYTAHGRNDLRGAAFAEIAAVSAELPPSHDGWFAVRFPSPLRLGDKDGASDDDRLLIALEENRNVEWALRRPCEIAEMVERSHDGAEWRRLGTMATLRLTPAPPLGEAANVINGLKQRFSRGPTNMWMSRPEDGLPQDLLLAWKRPRRISEVHLTFDNLTAQRHDYPWESGTRVLPILVKSYELAYWARCPTAPCPAATSSTRRSGSSTVASTGSGVSEAAVQVQGADQISVALPGIKNVDQAVRTVGQTAQLQFFNDGKQRVAGPEGSLAAAVKTAETAPLIPLPKGAKTELDKLAKGETSTEYLAVVRSPASTATTRRRCTSSTRCRRP